LFRENGLIELIEDDFGGLNKLFFVVDDFQAERNGLVARLNNNGVLHLRDRRVGTLENREVGRRQTVLPQDHLRDHFVERQRVTHWAGCT
jgi:hypothetical protein